jgi:hypothetical protein
MTRDNANCVECGDIVDQERWVAGKQRCAKCEQERPVETKHKGLVCPRCNYDGGEEDAAFRYLEDIASWRRVVGFNAKGVLEINGYYQTSGYDDGTNPRIECGKCDFEFPIPDDVADKIEWI